MQGYQRNEDSLADMIMQSTGGHDNFNVEDDETQPGTQWGLSIDAAPLFGDEEEGFQVGDEEEGPVMDDDEELVEIGKKVRSASYTEGEDRVMCKAWMIHGQDSKMGTQKKGKAYWKKVHRCFHEMRKFKKWNFESDYNVNSLNKRWVHIQAECNKFNGALDRILARP